MVDAFHNKSLLCTSYSRKRSSSTDIDIETPHDFATKLIEEEARNEADLEKMLNKRRITLTIEKG